MRASSANPKKHVASKQKSAMKKLISKEKFEAPPGSPIKQNAYFMSKNSLSNPNVSKKVRMNKNTVSRLI